jgi:hypothetical protein
MRFSAPFGAAECSSHVVKHQGEGMTHPHDWIKQALTELRKLDRSAQRTHLQNVLSNVDAEGRAALRHEIEARRSRVQHELRTHQGRGQPEAMRKVTQKEAMISRYNWLLHVMDQQEELQSGEDSSASKS